MILAWKRLRRLSGRDIRLLAQAVLWLWICRIGLWCLPLRVLQRGLKPLAQPRSRSSDELDRLRWALDAGKRRVPGTCLTQALAGQIVLARHGFASAVQLGVAKGESGRVEAHAWLECGDLVVVGDQELHRYSRLARFPGPPGS